MPLVDGLGGEEVNQDVNVQTGSIITQGPISGAGTIFGNAVVVGTTLDVGTTLSGGNLRVGSVDAVGGIEATNSISGQHIFYQTALSGANARLGSVDSIGGITALQSISGLNLLSQGSVISAKISDEDGRLRSAGFGTDGGILYSNFVQGGSVLTTAGSEAVVDFGVDYTGSYAIVFTAMVTTDGEAAAFVSGILELSGCTMVGGASAPYMWMSIGPV